MRLVDRLRGTSASSSRSELDWSQLQQWMNFDGVSYPLGIQSTLGGSSEEIGNDYLSYVQRGYRSNGIVFAVEALRTRVFAEARFAWQRREQGRPQTMFTDQRLDMLERPWPGGTTQDLLQRMLLHADLGGNAYVTVNRRGRLKLLRPDWVTIVRGMDDPDDIDSELVGYLYKPGGKASSTPAVALGADEVAHFVPDPDPEATFRGMSWLTPLLREIAGDTAMSMHKNKYLENAATPNIIVRLDASVTPEQFREFKREAEGEHRGWWNAYKTMYLGGGADVTVAGSDFKQLDFKVVQGHGETRIAAAAGVHPVVVGLSEGMQGSSLNAGNYAQARRNVADTTFHPLWRNVAGSLQTIMSGDGPDLVCDLRDVPFLRQDEKDAADIQRSRVATLNALLSNGWTPESAKTLIMSDDFGQLEHTGLLSVQLQDPAGTPQLDAVEQSS